MSIFQLIATIFAATMLYIVNIHKRKLSLSKIEVTFWYSLWLVFILFALWPDLLLGIVAILHFSRVFDLLLVLAMMVLTTIVVMSYFGQKEAAKKLEDYVRQQAIKNVQIQNKNG